MAAFFAKLAENICSANGSFPGELDINSFFRLNVTTMLVNMVVMMITFFFSCLFNETRLSLGFGSGIPIMFLLLNMLGGSASDLKILSDISIFGFYDPVNLVAGNSVLGANLVYVGIIAVLFAGAILIFNKKRLPL